MKAGLLYIAALAANAAALALPANVKREIVTDFFTQIEYVTATAPAAVVYVDQNGSPISAPTNAVQHGNWHGGSGGWHGHSSAAAPAPAPAVTTVAPVVPAPVIPAVSTPEAPAPVFSTPEVPAAPAPSTPATGSSGSGSGNALGLGITYSPYTSGPCKSADEVKSDLAGFSDYSLVRIYGTDCNQISNVLAALNQGSTQQKLFIGIYNIDSIDSEVESVKSQVAGRWNMVDTISVGNEHVANGRSASDVSSKVASARAGLNAAGYSGTVATVDTVKSYLDNPSLCAAGDDGAHSNVAVYANCHAFFDPNTVASNAGSFVQGQIKQIQSVCPGREVIITESGWPSSSALGLSNGMAVASLDNQKTAISSLKSSFSSNLFLFSAYNEQWKPVSASTFGVEQFWGILGNSQFN